MKKVFTMALLLSAFIGSAQVKIGENPTTVDPNAVLEMESTSKGMMLPRMSAAQRDAITAPSNSMLIFNTTENCINVYNGTLGTWKSLCGDEASGSAEFTADCSSLLVTGTYTTGVALNPSNNYLTVNVDVTTLGSYNILASSAGMYFAASGTFTTLGTQTITLGGQGYPLVSGVNFLALDINGELCTTVITVANGVAVITGCGTTGAFTGSLVTGQAIADGSVYQSYTAGPAYTGGPVFGITSATTNGIRISTPVNGTFSASGDPIDYFLTGTPVLPGNTTINYTINGFACSFTVPVQSGTGFASSVNCSGAPAGTYTVGTAMTGSNTKGISLNVTTPGTFTARTNTANGIYFEGTATLAAGAQTMTLTAVGTPATITPTTYTVTISTTATTFVTCTFTVTPVYPPSVPTFNTLNCAALGMSATGGVNYVKANNTGSADNFGVTGNNGNSLYANGIAISADGLTMAVGAPYEDGDLTGGAINSTNNNNWSYAGAVYVYTRANKQTNWAQQAKIKPTQLGAGDIFGAAVRLSDNGNTLVVGSTQEKGSGTGVNPAHNDSAAGAGAAYVFIRSGSTWSQQAYLKASNTQQGDAFGASVAISGDGNTVAVGAVKEDGSGTGVNPASNEGKTDSGAVYVFTRSGSTWSHQAYIKGANPGLNDVFGYKIAMSTDGNTLAVGAAGEDGSGTGINPPYITGNTDNSGAVYIYSRSGSTWSQQAYLKSPHPEKGDAFGAVSLSGDGNTLVVGAWAEDGNGTGVNPTHNNLALESGAVYTFTRSGATWASGFYIKSPDTQAIDRFAYNVNISKDGNSIAVGAVYDATSTTCINGADDNVGVKVGSVYLYNKIGSNWINTFKFLRPSVNMKNADNLNFGHDVCLDQTGNTVSITVPGEDGSATGINGAYNTSASASGAVVTYTRN